MEISSKWQQFSTLMRLARKMHTHTHTHTHTRALKALGSLGVAVVAMLNGFSQAYAADVVVQPDSNYFNGWSFTSITSPTVSPLATIFMAPEQQGTGTLVNRSFTFSVAADPVPNSFGVFPDNYNVFGLYIPANIGFVTTPRPGQFFIARGNETVTFASPLPSGTTFFFQDFDNNEQANYRFQDCSGNPVDAGDFDFLQISTINTPTHTVMGTAPARYWHVASPVSSDPNTVNGLVIKSDQVCTIQIEASRDSNGGSVNYFLGGPTASLYVPPAPVPTLSQSMLVALAAMLAFAAAGLGVRRRKP